MDKQHGRLDVRILTVRSMVQHSSDWPYLAQVFNLERFVTDSLGSQPYDVRYGVTSLPAERLLVLTRSEWGIENGLHYRRDVTLDEDASQLRRGSGPQVMAALSNPVIGFMYQAGERNLATAQRRFIYHVDRMLADLARAPLSRATLHSPYSDAGGFCLI